MVSPNPTNMDIHIEVNVRAVQEASESLAFPNNARRLHPSQVLNNSIYEPE